MDWHGWHDAYDEPGSELGRRLVVVRERIGEASDEAPTGPVRVVSACAGRGRDLLPDICDWLAERGSEQRWLSEPEAGFGVGVHRFTGELTTLAADASMFTFSRYRALRGTG